MSKDWLREHHNDQYVKLARKEGYRSRAVYKLQEIDDRNRILKRGRCVVDLGAAPGGWSQLAAERIGPKGRVIALDILPMDVLADVEVLQADFREQEGYDQLMALLAGQRPNLVLSDLAPNISGTRAVDQPRAMALSELSLDLARKVIAQNGDLLVKVFQGEGFDEFIREVRSSFTKVRIRKPKASRPRSREVYVLGQAYTV